MSAELMGHCKLCVTGIYIHIRTIYIFIYTHEPAATVHKGRTDIDPRSRTFSLLLALLGFLLGRWTKGVAVAGAEAADAL